MFTELLGSLEGKRWWCQSDQLFRQGWHRLVQHGLFPGSLPEAHRSLQERRTVGGLPAFVNSSRQRLIYDN